MYPLEEGLLYPKNSWWVAARSSEVGRALLQRTLLEEEVLFYRTTAGVPVAMSNRCPHRLFPLSKGTLKGDAVQCGYHGFVFGSNGRCVHMPVQDRIPSSMQVRDYPVAEHMGWVWIWMGDPALADPAKLPRPRCVTEPGWEITHGTDLHVAARYTLLIDNLFDLSHIAFLHAASIGGVEGEKPAGFDAPVELVTEGDTFRALRHHPWAPYDGYSTLLFGPGSGQASFDTVSDYHGPALVVTGGIHYFEEGKAGPFAIRVGDRPGGSLRNIHAITPQTRNSTHYFAAFARNFRLGDDQFSKLYEQVDHQVRVEDQMGLELIEPAAARAVRSQEQSGVQDGAAIRVRRLLSQQIAAEAAATTK